MPRTLVLLAAVLFGTTGTAQALGPEGSPLEVGAARVAVGAALLALVAWGVERWRHTSAPSRRWPLPALAGAAERFAVSSSGSREAAKVGIHRLRLAASG